ncbi:MAG: hypothetical protein QM710_05885 [Flavobacterium sp.]
MKKVIIIALLFGACTHYVKDKLIIKNNTKDEIWYSTFAKEDNLFTEISGGGIIEPGKNDSPPIRSNYISDELSEYSNNKILYVVFYKEPDQEYLRDNTSKVINGNTNEKYKIYKYSLDELKKNNWRIIYNGYKVKKQ